MIGTEDATRNQPSRRRGQDEKARTPGEKPSYVAVVRRGQEDLFYTLQENFDKRGLARTLWDRRTEQRRGRDRSANGAGSSDRRHGDRRGLLPDTWATLNFVFSPQGGRRPSS